jgi:hypothetical protein
MKKLDTFIQMNGEEVKTYIHTDRAENKGKLLLPPKKK